jgi:hypothetical protein
MIAAARKILFILCINIDKGAASVTWLWMGKYVLCGICIVGDVPNDAVGFISNNSLCPCGYFVCQTR